MATHLEFTEADTYILKTPKQLISENFPPRMMKIVQCESGFKQEVKGRVLKSPTNDYGLMQINGSWIPKAKKLGYNIMTLEGNVEMGKWIYKNAGGINNWSCNKLV